MARLPERRLSRNASTLHSRNVQHLGQLGREVAVVRIELCQVQVRARQALSARFRVSSGQMLFDWPQTVLTSAAEGGGARGQRCRFVERTDSLQLPDAANGNFAEADT